MENKEYHKEYYIKNKEHFKEYYQKNKTKIKERQLINSENICLYNKERYVYKRDEILSNVADYYQNNKPRISQYKKAWYLKNKERILNKYHKQTT